MVKKIFTIIISASLILTAILFIYPLVGQESYYNSLVQSPNDKGAYLNYSYSRCMGYDGISTFDVFSGGDINITSTGNSHFQVKINCCFRGNKVINSWSETINLTSTSSFIDDFLLNKSLGSGFISFGSISMEKESYNNIKATDDHVWTNVGPSVIYPLCDQGLGYRTGAYFPGFSFTYCLEPVRYTPTKLDHSPIQGANKNTSLYEQCYKYFPNNVFLVSSGGYTIPYSAFLSGSTNLLPYLYKYNDTDGNLFKLSLKSSNLFLAPHSMIYDQTLSFIILTWIWALLLMALIGGEVKVKRNNSRKRNI